MKLMSGTSTRRVMHLDVDHLAAADPAQRVDGMDAVVQHVVAGFQVGVDLVLVEAADGMDDGAAFQASFA